MYNPESVQENETLKLLWDFLILTDHLISPRRPDQVIVNKKKVNLLNREFAISAAHRVNLKGEKRNNYLDLAIELKKQWNIKVTVIPIVVGALGMVPKELVKELEDLEIRGQVETIQTTA